MKLNSDATLAVGGGLLVTHPYWGPLLQNFNLLAYTLAGICGAIMGIASVIGVVVRLVKWWRNNG